MATHNELGHIGEQLAATFLEEKGYHILEKNYRFDKAEIDIIAQKEHILAVVEVKTRTSKVYGNPQEFVSQKKIKLLVKAIDEYVTSNELDVEVRFDIIAIIHNKATTEISHIKDAFYHF